MGSRRQGPVLVPVDNFSGIATTSAMVNAMKPGPLPPELQGRAFRSEEARAHGVGHSRLMRHELDRPSHGVWTPAVARGVVEECHAVLPLLPCDAAFSHETAAAIHGLPLPPRLADRSIVHVTTETTTAQRRRPAWFGHRGGESRQIDTVRGLPVIGAIDTWCDLGAYAVGRRRIMTLGDLVMIGDCLLNRLAQQLHPMATSDELREPWIAPSLRRKVVRVLSQRVRPRGKTALEPALGMLRLGVRSPQESRARVAIVLSGLPEPRINERILSADGSHVLAEGDLVWDEPNDDRRVKVVGEYQGVYHADREQRSRDSHRAERLRDDGWVVHEIWAEDINQADRRWQLLLRLARALEVPPTALTPVRWL